MCSLESLLPYGMRIKTHCGCYDQECPGYDQECPECYGPRLAFLLHLQSRECYDQECSADAMSSGCFTDTTGGEYLVDECPGWDDPVGEA